MMKRRNFIIGTAAGLAASRVSTPVVAGPGFSTNPFTLGVASGDVTQDSAVLWTRLAPEPLAADGGLGRDAIPVRWELFRDEEMQQLIRQGEELAVPQLVHSIHADVRGLEPGRDYWYRFSVGAHTSEAGRTKTLPARNSQTEAIRFVTVSCQNYAHGYFVAYDHIVADNPDFVIHLGDYIYETSYGVNFRRHETEVMPLTLDGFRRRHALYKTDENLKRAHARLPFFTTLDNHDAVIDTDPATMAIRAAAYQAWYEHMPVRGYGNPGDDRFELQRTVHAGDLMQVSLLDTRQFRARQLPCSGDRSPHGFGNYVVRCPEMFAEERTMLGEEQENWLADNIQAGSTPWNVIASSSVFSPFHLDIDGKSYNFAGSWDGYPANRSRVVDAINRAETGQVVVLSGDMHSFWAIDGMQSIASADRFPGVEFVASSISANWPDQMDKPIADNLVRNPQIKFYEPDRRGYLLHEVTAKEWQTTARAVQDVRDAQSGVFDLARFIVESGKPGLRRVSTSVIPV